MKFNSLFLLLLSFVSFSLFSMGSESAHVRKTTSAPNSPYFKPQKPSPENLPRKFSLPGAVLLTEASNQVPQEILPKIVLCIVCEQMYPAEILSEHMKACQAQKLAVYAAAVVAGAIVDRSKKTRGLTKGQLREKAEAPMDLD